MTEYEMTKELEWADEPAELALIFIKNGEKIEDVLEALLEAGDRRGARDYALSDYS